MVIDISRLDYARQVYGLTATSTARTAEWLPLLVDFVPRGGAWSGR
jgi:hypothetical protein